MVALFRYSIFPEDEGRNEFMGIFKTLEAANAAKDKYIESGYYTDRDFFTLEDTNETYC